MTRGLIKLKYTGKRDQQLTGNPKICFWKSVYKQHTNFAKQSNQIDYEGDSYMQNNTSSVFRFRLLRNAELVNFISLKLKLPDIFSHSGHLGEFRWIKNIGTSIIEYARLYYDNILIEEIDGDFLTAYRDLLLNSDKIDNFNKLIGNVQKLNNPYQNNIYPSYTNSVGDLSGADFYINRDYNTNASIKEYLLNVPLLFCFFREKSFIPLVSNKLREVYVEVKLRPLKELYTLIENTKIQLNIPTGPSSYFLMSDATYATKTDANIATAFPDGRTEPVNEYQADTVNYRKRIVDPSGNIFNFTQNIANTYFVPNLEVEYIFLDNVERKKFALENLSQTFAFNKKLTFNNLVGTNKLFIEEFHPVKSMFFISKRNDINTKNEWSNFSNNDYEEQNIRYLQNNITNICHKEALNQGDSNFIKHLGSFLKNAGSGFNCIIEKGRYTDISGRLVKLKGVDFLASKPKITLKDNNDVKYNLAFEMLLRYLFIINGGENYIKNPRLLDNNNNVIPANIDINNGHIESVRVKNDITFESYMDFHIEPQLYCNSLNIRDNGYNYTSLPSLYIQDGNSLKKIPYTGTIKNGKITQCKLLDNILVSERGQVFAGGQLKNITCKSSDNIPPDLSFTFFDPHSQIIKPDIEIKDNKVSILDSGYGLSKNTELCVGKIISKLQIPKNLKLTDNIFDYEIVPLFYPKEHNSAIKNEYTKKPILDIKYSPLRQTEFDYKIFFDNEITLNKELLIFGKKISNNKLSINLNITELPKSLYSKDLYLTFFTNHDDITFNLGNCENIKDLPLKIIHNLETDITNKLPYFAINNINCAGVISDYITIFGDKTLSELNLQQNDLLTLFINEKEFSTVIVKELNDCLIGLGENIPDFKDLKKYNNQLLFGNFTGDSYKIEFGKNIEKIELSDVDSIRNLTLSNNSDLVIDLSEVKYKLSKKPLFDILKNIEYDYGGDKKALHEFVSYEISNGFLNKIYFNNNYDVSEYIWKGYTKPPIFVLKNKFTQDRRFHLREKIDLPLLLDDTLDNNIFQDALVEGVIDYGGKNFKGIIVDNNNGFGGNIELEKVTKNLFTFNFKNLGYNYNAPLSCTLISYKIYNNKLYNLNILDQFEVKINQIGQIENDEQQLWKNNKPISNIEIIWDKNIQSNNYTVYNAQHNIHTQYKLILGNIPNQDVGIINNGSGFNNEETNLLYETSCKNILFNLKFTYFTTIKNSCITKISIDTPKINNYSVPLVGYSISNNKLIIKNVEYFIETAKQLTGFKIVDKGYNLTNNSRLYNGFITKLPKITSDIDLAYFEIGKKKFPLIIKDNKLQIRNENKFVVTNKNYTYPLLNYMNININNKLKNNIASNSELFIVFSEVKVVSKTSTITIMELEEKQPNFPNASELFFASEIQDIQIIHPGNELDDMYSLYKLLLKNSNNEIIDLHGNILVEFQGNNSNTTRGNIFDMEIYRDGGGFGAYIEPYFMHAKGCNLLSIMGVDECVIENCSPEYGGNDLTESIDSVEVNHLCQNVYTWNTIDGSQLISEKDTIELDNIRKFMDTWQYRDPMNIPILDKNNYYFYNSSNAINKLGIYIDGKEREAIRDIDYYKYLEKYFTMKNAVDSNVILYSFCLDNNRLQPNGSINLSSLDNLCINLELKNPYKETSGKETYKYDVSVFLQSYNVIEYINGEGSLKYGN